MARTTEQEAYREADAGNLAPTHRHVPALDGIRGLAVLLVMVCHYTLIRGGGLGGTLLRHGGIGVVLFFVLSGYLITGILYDSKGGEGYFRRFYTRRALRIFPLYYGFLLAYSLYVSWYDADPWFAMWWDALPWHLTYLSNFFFAQGSLSAAGTDHFWSLAVEEQFYLLWPPLVLLLGRKQLLRVCVALIIASALFRMGVLWAGESSNAAKSYLPGAMDGLAAGAWIALYAREAHGREALRRWMVPVGLLSGALTVALQTDPGWIPSVLLYSLGRTVPVIAFGCLIVAALQGGGTAALFGRPALRFFGRYSYALYVFHYPILFFLQYHGFSGETVARQLALYAAGGVLSIAAALVSWHVLESPFLALKDRLAPPGGATVKPAVPRLGQRAAV